MARTVAIGIQDFSTIIKDDIFYIDKTNFIKDWWDNKDNTTVIMRPRRFGKTLTLSMVENFFSVKYAKAPNYFEHLNIWQDERFRELKGTYPVIFLSFAGVKENTFDSAVKSICRIIHQLFNQNRYLLDGTILSETEKVDFLKVNSEMDMNTASQAINRLSEYLSRYHNQKVLILLDEYDTPMQEAFVNGYWGEIVDFMRSMFNTSFKSNLYMERALMTGITRISKESIFSDLNHPKIVTMTSEKYAASFGFTEQEVFEAMEEYGYEEKEKVKKWYDGFTIGSHTDIYNPWSIINYLEDGKFKTYWANTSSNDLANQLIKQGNTDLKEKFETLINGKRIIATLDDEIIFSQLSEDNNSIWSLLFASGYLKGRAIDEDEQLYELEITNYETYKMFTRLIKNWFGTVQGDYNGFVKALLQNNIKYMNKYMNEIALATFSTFDTGNRPSEITEPERFYHGFVLGLMVELKDKYSITSNRESGFGRYDVVLEPLDARDAGIIIEFKVYDKDDEKGLEDTVKRALKQINDNAYETNLLNRGICDIRKYGFAFKGKNVLIGT